MAAPKVVLFDLDDTLISAYGAPELAWSEVAAEFSDELHPYRDELVAEIMAAGSRYWSEPERSRRARLDIANARREIVGEAFSRLRLSRRAVLHDDLVERLVARFSQYRDDRMRLFDDAHQVLDRFRERGVRIGLVTNGAGPAQRAKIARFDLGRRIDYVQIEGEAGYGKPDPRSFLTPMRALDAAPESTWMIGDNYDADIATPMALGLRAVWFNPTGLVAPKGAPPAASVVKLSALLTDVVR